MSIYIPIWIDLKAQVQRSFISAISYLHSNMDRFESVAALYLIFDVC